MDYQPAVAQRAGIGRYVRILARHLLETSGREDQLRLFFLDFNRRATDLDVPGAEIRAHRMIPGRCLQRCWRHWNWPSYDALSGTADVYHFTNFILPPLRRGKSAVTIFDMSFERFPEFAEEENLKYLRSGIRRTVERADAILTISSFSADEIEQMLPAARGKTHPVLLGISPEFKPAKADEVAAMRKRLGIDRPYLLTVGTLEPRKNLPFLMEAFERLNPNDLDLVIAGMAGWKCGPILERMKSSRRASSIHYVDYIPDGALPALYSGAELFVLTSHYEGFGFPPLEAMACGTPVLSSDGGSLPEVLGEGAVVLKGFDADAWASALQTLLEDSGRREQAVEAGLRQARRYRWEDTARKTWDVYRSLIP